MKFIEGLSLDIAVNIIDIESIFSKTYYCKIR